MSSFKKSTVKMKNVLIISLLIEQILGEGFPYVSDISQLQCQETGTYYDETEMPRCLTYDVQAGDECTENIPGYKCKRLCNTNKEEYECESNKDCQDYFGNIRITCFPTGKLYAEIGNCMSYHIIHDPEFANYNSSVFKPDCLNDGNWAPKQCKGDNDDRCMCFDPFGKRLFGQATTKQDKMTCACSRKKAQFLGDSTRMYDSLHCDSMGNYEPLQCDNGQCWCADVNTGDPKSPVVPEKAMKRLPCYKESEVGTQYLRKCDSEEYAIRKMEYELKIHGVTQTSFGHILCDYDGGYGNYMLSSTTASCTWRDGSKIESFTKNIQMGIQGLNCNCARDLKLYSHKRVCTEDGNYQPIQQNGDEYFCVDSDGFAKSPATSDPNMDCSLYIG